MLFSYSGRAAKRVFCRSFKACFVRTLGLVESSRATRECSIMITGGRALSSVTGGLKPFNELKNEVYDRRLITHEPISQQTKERARHNHDIETLKYELKPKSPRQFITLVSRSRLNGTKRDAWRNITKDIRRTE